MELSTCSSSLEAMALGMRVDSGASAQSGVVVDGTLAPPVSIALIDDSEADAMLIQIAARRSSVHAEFQHFLDGRTALEHLEDARYPLPDLILLDVNMPGLNGHQVLEAIRLSPRLRLLPVIILSSSDDESDINRGYEHFVNAYLVKPIGMQGFQGIIEALDEFWFSQVVPNLRAASGT